MLLANKGLFSLGGISQSEKRLRIGRKNKNKEAKERKRGEEVYFFYFLKTKKVILIIITIFRLYNS